MSREPRLRCHGKAAEQGLPDLRDEKADNVERAEDDYSGRILEQGASHLRQETIVR